MSCKKALVLISVLLVLLAVCFAAPAESQDNAVTSGIKDGSISDDKDDLKPAASHWGGGHWGGHFGGYSGGYYPYWGGGNYWGWPSYAYGHGYGHGYGYPYGYYGHHGFW